MHHISKPKKKKASAIANSNIALIKYWGKRDDELHLPYNNSISVTLSGLFTHTTVDFNKEYSQDVLILNGKRIKPDNDKYKYIAKFLNSLRKSFPQKLSGLKIKIVSKNNFPTGAGLASSASGFAALTAACNEALGLGLDKRQLSILARRGSGSAARSIFGGFVEWHKGSNQDGSDSYASQIADKNYWPEFKIIICTTNTKEKEIKSRAGMRTTIKTCPFYSGWLKTIKHDIEIARQAITEKDFSSLGQIAETNCLKLHALMITTYPPIIYWNESTISLIRSILNWRKEGLECYFTIDAGPQVKILCRNSDTATIIKKLKDMTFIKNIKLSQPGSGVKISNFHLF